MDFIELKEIINNENERKRNAEMGCSNHFCDITGGRRGMCTNSTCDCLRLLGKAEQLAIRRRFWMKDMVINFLLKDLNKDPETTMEIYELNKVI